MNGSVIGTRNHINQSERGGQSNNQSNHPEAEKRKEINVHNPQEQKPALKPEII